MLEQFLLGPGVVHGSRMPEYLLMELPMLTSHWANVSCCPELSSSWYLPFSVYQRPLLALLSLAVCGMSRFSQICTGRGPIFVFPDFLSIIMLLMLQDTTVCVQEKVGASVFSSCAADR